MAKYYKYKYSDFVQPILTSNGTLGGDSFACVASGEMDSSRKAWNAFDGVNSSSESGCWHSTSGSSHWLNFYNPKQLKISKIIIHNRPSTSTGAVNSIGNFRILNSNDNSNWEQVYSGQNTNNSSKAQIVVDIPDTAEPAKYWQINILSNLETTYTAIGEIEIEAQEVTLVEATKDDYDVVEYDYCVAKKPKYYKYQTWTQPILTSNSSSSVMTVSATNEGQHEAYKALDNSNSTFWCTANSTTTATLTTTFNENIYISSIEVTGLSTDWGFTKTIQISSENGVIGETKTFNTATSQSSVTNTWTFATPIKAKKLSFYCTGSLWVAIREIKINAKKAVEATKDDYDVIEYEPCVVKQNDTFNVIKGV